MNTHFFRWNAVLTVAGAMSLAAHSFSQSAIAIAVDANANRQPISPFIYGVNYGTAANMLDLNATINREGGNPATRYNWSLNADNRAWDWFFESIGDSNATAGYRIDSMISGDNAANAQTMVTIPMIGWIANLGAGRANLWSFSVAKYGPQTATDGSYPDAGNGISTAAGNPFITGNNPADADVASTSTTQQAWMAHLVSKWGKASAGGLKYYLMDQESSVWFQAHRDVHPTGPKMDEILDDILDYGSKVKATDPSALVGAPDEWGWSGYFLSGFDQQYTAAHNYNGVYPDRANHGNMDYIPYLLQQIKAHDTTAGTKTIDILTLHFYPQDGSNSDDVRPGYELLRNMSTRALWDPTYTDRSWIDAPVELIPRMKAWVAKYYPGLQTGITEYNWGAEASINGATTQADILGIFGVQGLDVATRWEVPDPSTPTYKAMKLFRNYDGLDSTFGDVSVSATGPDPDNVAVYASTRTADNRLTIMVINKQLTTTAHLTITTNNFTSNDTAQVWQLTSANAITRLCDVPVPGGVISTPVPPQSITLFVVQPSTAAVTIPPTPTGLKAAAQTTSAVLTWNGSPGAMEYEIYRSLSPTTGFAKIGRATGTVYTDTGLTTGTPYYYEVEAANIKGYSSPCAAVKAVPVTPDTTEYNFESSAQGWTSTGGLLTSVAQSSAEAYAGSYSLALNIKATGADSQYAEVLSPAIPAGKTVTFHVWVPAGCGLTAVEPYVLQGASGGWTFTGTYTPISSLTAGAWNTVTVATPANAVVPLYSLGVEVISSSPWAGTCYVDSVSW
jgi:hypothetical protein